jgi:hypothetical protein
MADDPKQYVAGSSSLVLGCDSYTSPAEVGDTEYIMGQNVVCRGGILQTRPGSRSLFCLPDGNFQGCTLFTPANGVAHLVFAVNGAVYVSAAPFASYRRLWTLQFSLTAKFMAWAVCLKSTDYDIEGNLIFLENPYSVLMMQDGLTRAAYWDGSTAAHINPAPAPDATDTPVPGYQGTPVGLWMIWSGNRLWVSRGNQIFASDIGNPLKFTESQYLNEGRAFYLSGPCTGLIETPDQQGIIAFTQNDGTFFQSVIQDRTTWLTTPQFQKIVLPNIGCVAPRSLMTQYGLNWWFSARGLTNFNAALRLNITSRIDYQDNQMFASKAYLSPELSGVCGSFYENYLMMSVPSADVLNRHTWVLDQAPFDGNVNAWTGFWSGWRPIEWARGIVNGDERMFFGSIDYDGKNRIWEAMLEEKKDNGCAITCYAQLRDHAAGNLDRKRYEWSKFYLSQILGDVHLNVYVASTKGGYQLQKGYKIVANEGQIFMDQQYSEAGPLMIGNRVQSRVIRTPSDPDPNDCNACGVESKGGNMIDYAFSHLLVWSGQMGIRAYQMFMRESPDRNAGDCEEDEVGPRTLNAQGCSGLALLVDTEVFEQFTGSAEGTARLNNGTLAYIRQEKISVISQADADSKAACAVAQVQNRVEGQSIPGGVYNLGSARLGEGSYMIVASDADVTDNPDPIPDDLDALVVAGGGAGGSTYGGGGGAGGVIEQTYAGFDFTATYPVVVGAGGTGAANQALQGGNGNNSTFNGLTAVAGGGGGSNGSGVAAIRDGRDGGSGGGRSSSNPGSTPGDGTVGQGNNGGVGDTNNSSWNTGGGGGGANAVGETTTGLTRGGNGGVGIQSSISGVSTYYGGGGGGGGTTVGASAAGGSGGLGGGGAGGQAGAGVAGTANTGGGGGGGGYSGAVTAGGNGGSGVVILRYPGTQRMTGGVVTTAAGDTIHTFNSNGSFAPI